MEGTTVERGIQLVSYSGHRQHFGSRIYSARDILRYNQMVDAKKKRKEIISSSPRIEKDVAKRGDDRKSSIGG